MVVVMSNMPHNCKYFIVHCIDFRFQKAIRDYLEKSGILVDCDIVSVVGAVKNSPFIAEQLDISVKLHDVREAILINHIDCGAYGGSGAFDSLERECQFHAAELNKAKKLLLGKHPSLKVKIMLAQVSQQESASVELKEFK